MLKKLPYLDLRPIADCRDVETWIDVNSPAQRGWHRWIRLGRVTMNIDDSHFGVIDGFAGRGATDPFESSARILRLPVVFLPQDSFYHGLPTLRAVIVGGCSDFFRVPPPGYNPFAHPETHACERCEDRHPMFPEGYYVPPPNRALYREAAGRIIRLNFYKPRRRKLA